MDARDARFIAGLTPRLSFASRDARPKQVEKVPSVEDLAASMDKPETEAAVFESGEIASQETFNPYRELVQRCLNEMLVALFWNEDVETSRIGSDESYLTEADRAFSKYGNLFEFNDDQKNTARGFLHDIIRGMLKTMRAFRNKRIVRYTTRFVQGDYGTSQESRGWHTDPSTGPYQNEMTVVRTYVGPSTMLKHVGTKREVAPRPGATVAFRVKKDESSSLNFLHRTPPLAQGEFRFALIFNVADLETK